MSTDNPGSTAPQGGASPPAGTPPADAAAPTPGNPAPDGPKYADLNEVKAMRQEWRAFEKKILDVLGPGKPEPTPKPKKAEPDGAVDVAAIEAKWERKLALKDAIADLGIGTHRKAIERLYAAENPEDPGAWLAQTAADFGWSKAAPGTPTTPAPAATPTPAPKPTPAPGTSNLGPPGADTKLPLPDDIMSASVPALKGMSKEDRKKYFERSVGGGIGDHPVHRRR